MNSIFKPNNTLKTFQKTYLTYIFLSLFFISTIQSQVIELEIKSLNEIENSVLKLINHKKVFKTETNIKNEILSISNKLKEEGYFFNNIDSINKITPKKIIAFYNLSKKYQKIIINNQKFKKKNDTLKINKLSDYITTLNNSYKKNGELFNEIQLKNIEEHGDFLTVDILITKKKKRTIDDIVIKGYTAFKKEKIKKLINFKKNIVANDKSLNSISKTIKSLNFIDEIKKPEFLFSKDSTFIYVYIKQKKSNSFDGIVNFTSKENGNGVLFTGNINLNLNNIFKATENITLNWRANGNQNQNLLISNTLPYIFNSKFSNNLELNIYKQDSSFLNSKFTNNALYNISPKSKIGISYINEVSTNNSNEITSNEVQNFKKNLIGINFSTHSLTKNNFNEKIFFVNFKTLIGNRKTTYNETQVLLQLETHYLYQINKRNSVFLRNESGLLNSSTMLTNDLFRIGGANSIRGFNEESIFAKNYSYLNSEYRFNISTDSVIYSIFDIGLLTNQLNQPNTIYNLGIGFRFKNKSNYIDLNYNFNRLPQNNLILKKPKINIQITSFF